MKRTAIFWLAVCMLFTTGCGAEKTFVRETPDEADTVVTSAAEKADGLSATQLRTSDSDENYISYEIKGEMLNVSGHFSGESPGYVLLQYAGEKTEEQKNAPVENGRFSLSRELPDKDVTVNFFGGDEEYGMYDSIVIDFVKLKNKGGEWVIEKSPIYGENKAIWDLKRDELGKYTVSTDYIQADDLEIISLSNEITAGIGDDAKKALAIHDWVAENIYYDFEAFYSGDYQNSDSLNVLHSKRAVCEGYANLFAALARAQNIPCTVRSGYALGIGIEKTWTNDAINTDESNHAWNEVYIDGRWIIVDATWDSRNKIENGTMTKGKSINHIYFDSSLDFFSLSHKLMK